MSAMRNLIRVLAIWLALLFGIALMPFGFTGFALWRLALARRPETERIARTQRVFHRAFGLMHRLLARAHILDFDPGDVAAGLPEGPCVIVANHPTFADTSALIASHPQLTAVVKSRMYRRWWLRPLFEQAGYIEDTRGDFLGAERSVAAIVARLERGERVLVFPEGTRTVGRGLHPFGRTAFEAACRADVPVAPVSIRCEPLWLNKGWRPWRPPRDGVPRLSLRSLPVARPAEHQGSSRRLRDAIYHRLTSACMA